MFDRTDQLEAIGRDGVALADAVAAISPTAVVEGCPGWTAMDLTWHVGRIHHLWRWVVAAGATDLSTYPKPTRPADVDLVGWYRAGVGPLVEALDGAEPSSPLWWWGTGAITDLAWVTRRMAHETAVHRWDAERAAGREWAMPPALAADGLAEFFAFVALRPVGAAATLGGTVHLHATDSGLADGEGEWLVEADGGGGIRARPEHAKGDVAVQGTAADLLLALWRRIPLDDRFTIFGDLAGAQRLVAQIPLD